MSRCSVRGVQFAVTKPMAEIHKGKESWNQDKYGRVCTGSSSKGLVRKAWHEIIAIRVMVIVGLSPLSCGQFLIVHRQVGL